MPMENKTVALRVRGVLYSKKKSSIIPVTIVVEQGPSELVNPVREAAAVVKGQEAQSPEAEMEVASQIMIVVLAMIRKVSISTFEMF